MIHSVQKLLSCTKTAIFSATIRVSYDLRVPHFPPVLNRFFPSYILVIKIVSLKT